MLIETIERPYLSKWGTPFKKPKTKTIRICKCDNCRKIFELNAGIGNTHSGKYCSSKCYTGHIIGYCSIDTCNMPIMENGRKQRPARRQYLCHYHCDKNMRKEGDRRRTREKRREVIRKLGSKCVCCGEREPMYLQVDHTNNDGAKHRKKRQCASSPQGVLTPDDYLEAIDTGDYQLQLLCANCNNAKRMNNGELYRPHKWTRRSSQGGKCTS